MGILNGTTENIISASDKNLITMLLIFSFAMLLIPFLCWLIKRLLKKNPLKFSYRTGLRGTLIISCFVLLSVWGLRYAVGTYVNAVSPAGESLTKFEEIFNSMIHALQTVSMDEDYTEYILRGKEMVRVIFGDRFNFSGIYGVFASILNVVAPILGGALIFEIISSIFPKIRLYISYLEIWREKLFFSELNDASIALAKNIYDVQTSGFCRPVIIFTDAYKQENEISTEIYSEAKSIGALCLKDDIAHVIIGCTGAKKLFLIDKNPIDNLTTLADLTGSKCVKYIKCKKTEEKNKKEKTSKDKASEQKDTEIFLFYPDDSYVEAEKHMMDKLKNEYGIPENQLPQITLRQSKRNMIMNLLVDYPLFEPLVGRQTDELNVTILGIGVIGIQMFLNVYWSGQILGKKLNINVVSREPEEVFRGIIDNVNPEILETTKPGSPLLLVNKNGDYAAPYCNVNYISCDIYSEEFMSMIDGKKESTLLKTDYLLVALGKDSENIKTAELMKRYLGKYHLFTETDRKTFIAYVVYNTELAELLNRRVSLKKDESELPPIEDIYMRAIGSRKELYSVKNIFMPEKKKEAEDIDYNYCKIKNAGERVNKRSNDEYKYWANIARANHIIYKVYSAGMYDFSVFTDKSDSDYKEQKKEAYKKYKDMYCEENKDNADQDMVNSLAWLEHRRWNAFTRIKGYRSTDKYDTLIKLGISKHIELKLHACLVECDNKGKIENIKNVDVENNADVDMLDIVSNKFMNAGLSEDDYKKYDFPSEDFPKKQNKK